MLDPLRRITRDPAVMHGAACIRGMRLRVSDILDQLGAGETPASIREEWPELEDEDFIAVYRYARLAVEQMTGEHHA
jgi:uncharacterized protein (DUF433 family)